MQVIDIPPNVLLTVTHKKTPSSFDLFVGSLNQVLWYDWNVNARKIHSVCEYTLLQSSENQGAFHLPSDKTTSEWKIKESTVDSHAVVEWWHNRTSLFWEMVDKLLKLICMYRCLVQSSHFFLLQLFGKKTAARSSKTGKILHWLFQGFT